MDTRAGDLGRARPRREEAIVKTIAEQAAAVAAGRVSPVELVEAALEAIERVQPAINAFTHVLSDDARARAKELEASESLGPLHGVPVAVKELYDIAGVPTTGCCAAYASRIATTDSAVVERLRAAGAIVVAKTNQHELAHGGTSLVSSFGPVANPWDLRRTAGGSSGGSGAAVAAGTVAMAMGSDTGGSVRIPSSFCGVTGLKTTHGAVSLRGAMPLAPSLDTAGPLAHTAEDCRITFGAIAGYEAGDPLSRRATTVEVLDLPSLRIGVPAVYLDRLSVHTRRGIEGAIETLRGLGARFVDIDVPDPAEALMAFSPTYVAEFADAYRDLWDDDRISPDGARLLAAGRSMSAVDVAMGMRLSRLIRRRFQEVFEQVDLVFGPATPFPAPVAGEPEIEIESGTVANFDVEYARFTVPVNVAGLPALVFPAGYSPEGLPVGAQLMGPAWSEERLLAVGEAFQRATDWHTRMPAA